MNKVYSASLKQLIGLKKLPTVKLKNIEIEQIRNFEPIVKKPKTPE